MPRLTYRELRQLAVTPFVQAVLSASKDDLYGGVLAKRIEWDQRRWNYVQSAFFAGFEVTHLSALKTKIIEFYDNNPGASLKARIARPDSLPAKKPLPDEPEPDEPVEPIKPMEPRPLLNEPRSPSQSMQIIKLLGEVDEGALAAGEVDLLALRSQLEPQVDSERLMGAMLFHLRSFPQVQTNLELVAKVKEGFFNGRYID